MSGARPPGPGGSPAEGPADTNPPGEGWRALRRARERGFRIDFAPLRRVMRRDELLSATVELFVAAVVGVTKINLGGGASGAPPRSGGDATADGTSEGAPPPRSRKPPDR